MAASEAKKMAKEFKHDNDVARFQRSLGEVSTLHDDNFWVFSDGSVLEFDMSDGNLKVKTQ